MKPYVIAVWICTSIAILISWIIIFNVSLKPLVNLIQLLCALVIAAIFFVLWAAFCVLYGFVHWIFYDKFVWIGE